MGQQITQASAILSFQTSRSEIPHYWPVRHDWWYNQIFQSYIYSCVYHLRAMTFPTPCPLVVSQWICVFSGLHTAMMVPDIVIRRIVAALPAHTLSIIYLGESCMYEVWPWYWGYYYYATRLCQINKPISLSNYFNTMYPWPFTSLV